MFTILGAGLAGLSASFHLGHENCQIFEKNCYPGGHVASVFKNGFTWDEGPHVSFTKHEYVREFLSKSVDNEYLEYPVFPVNYFKGSWIPHPAQSNLYAIPEPLRTDCLNDFLSSRSQANNNDNPGDYYEWLKLAFGRTFADTFPSVYTSKYWTLPPFKLTTSWIGGRVYLPDIETVKSGFVGPSKESTHYITKVRYPKRGGFFNYCSILVKDADISFNKEVQNIDLKNKIIIFKDGEIHNYQKLISSIPLPLFIKYCDAPENVNNSADQLLCSELLLVNLEVDHPTKIKEHWLYVYDEDKFSTRINFTDLLSSENAPEGKSGIQVEVYFSRYRPKIHDDDFYAKKIIEELLQMGLIKSIGSVANYHTKWVPFANVIFDQEYKQNLDIVLSWLEEHGLTREPDDLNPITDWDSKLSQHTRYSDLILTGRFAEWKYYWSDDCILRGLYLSNMLKENE
jgi:protoporphyrinogen oxidase